MSMKSNYVTSIGVLLIIALIGYKLFANKKKIDENKSRATEIAIRIPVKVDTAQERLFELRITKTGSITPFKEVKALALTSGMIRHMRFDLGDHVKEGQVLAVMDTRTLQLDLQKAETNAGKLENDLKVYTELLEGKAATQEKVNEVRKNYQDAVNQVNQVKKNIEDASIKAPVSGIVSMKPAEPGMFVNAGGEIATVINLSKLKVAVNLTESEVYQVTQGQTVKIKTDVLPNETFSGSVTFISPQADATHNYKAEITMGNTGQTPLRSGTFVYVDFSQSTSEKMLVIPRDALIESVQNPSVYIVTDSVVHQKAIRTGKEIGTGIEVLEGLDAGTVVVTSGQVNLKEGSAISISR